ncbi:SpaH/EbpB family LPXTG-anchored major pilin [Ruminococcus sp.]|uniref:SpaH/EbpB family LPXTG-anchored major pilin n=1 Tax=Ruminococcus sp. TaxID=41978 RepID=UPI003EFCEC7C
MKAKKFSIFLLTTLMMLFALPLGAFAATRAVTSASTASITIENALPTDELSAYKVLDITYNDATNSLSYAWNSDFADYFAGTTSFNANAYTVEAFAALADDSAALKDLLANLPNYIATRAIAPVDTQTVAADGTATFADLAMGEYFIRPTATTSVYQLMLQKIEPTTQDSAYVIDDVTFTAKKEEVNVTKTADKTSVTKNEKVTYTITVDVPTYPANATDRTFSVSDLLPDGLTLDTASIKVQIEGVDVAAAAYTLATTATAEYTFKLSVDNAQYTDNWTAYGGKQLVITYTATLNDDDTTEVNVQETNTVTFDYSNYPYIENSHKQKSDTVDVTTFAIKIDKYAEGDESAKLANAKFDLYRTATQEENDDGTAVTIPHTSIKGVKLEGDLATDSNGVALFAKYEANGTNYDYYLVETQAPAGYNILDKAIKVNFTDADVKASAGIYTVKVPNSSGIKLPITGAAGTVIFTVIGIVLMAAAVLLLVFSRKKTKAK